MFCSSPFFCAETVVYVRAIFKPSLGNTRIDVCIASLAGKKVKDWGVRQDVLHVSSASGL